MQVMRSAKGLQVDPFALRFFARPVLLVSPLPSPIGQSVPAVWLSAAYLLAYHA
jgi:hypothetical protein